MKLIYKKPLIFPIWARFEEAGKQFGRELNTISQFNGQTKRVAPVQSKSVADNDYDRAYEKATDKKTADKLTKILKGKTKKGSTDLTSGASDFEKLQMNVISKVAEDNNIQVVFVNNTETLGYGEKNGFRTPDGKIVLALNNQGGLMTAYFGHELCHDLEGTNAYSALESEVMKYLAKTYGDENLQKRIDGIMQSQNLSEQSAKAEIVANSCMTVFDENFITNFAKAHTKEARTIKDWFNRLVARIRQAMDKVKKYVTEYRAISDDVAEVERIRDLFNAALGEKNANNSTNNTNVKYSNKNIDFERNIDEWDKEGRSNDETFIIGNTGDVLQGLGAIDNQIYFYGKKINAILKKHKDSMTLDIIKKVPDIIDNPALVLSSHSRSKSNNTRLLLFGTVKGSNGKPVMIVLDLQPFENGLLISDMQKLTSAYPLTRGQNGIRNYLNNCDVLYVTENKKIATKLVGQIGFFDPKKGLPIELQQSGYIGNISYSGRSVNIQGKPFSDVFVALQ